MTKPDDAKPAAHGQTIGATGPRELTDQKTLRARTNRFRLALPKALTLESPLSATAAENSFVSH
jgi:hypothetical protein